MIMEGVLECLMTNVYILCVSNNQSNKKKVVVVKVIYYKGE